MKRTLVALSVAAAFSANAGTVDPLLAKSDPCGQPRVIHVNGIKTTLAEATLNRDRIEEKYGNGHREHVVQYGLAYNKTRGFTSDMLDSAKMLLASYPGVTWDMLMRYVTFGTVNPSLSSTTTKAITTKLTDAYGITKPPVYQDADLLDIENSIKGQLQPHSRVVFMPHSQGNQYMLLVYDRLIAEGVLQAKQMAILGIAAPVTYIPGGGWHYTSRNDFVTDAARWTLGSGVLLPANVTIPYKPTVDVMGHNLIGIYLADPTVWGKIKASITHWFDTLKTTAPDPTAGLVSNAHVYYCGYTYTGAGPLACRESIDGGPLQWYTNTYITSWNDPDVAARQASLGVLALEPINRTYVETCYAWHVADRKLRIKEIGYVVPDAYSGLSYRTHGSCGGGYPFRTPYGYSDSAWKIYSADSSKLVVTGTTMSASATKTGVCRR